LAASTSEWKRVSKTFTVPSGAWYARIIPYSSAATWVYWDGIQLVEGSYPARYDPESSLWRYIRGTWYDMVIKGSGGGPMHIGVSDWASADTGIYIESTANVVFGISSTSANVNFQVDGNVMAGAGTLTLNQTYGYIKNSTGSSFSIANDGNPRIWTMDIYNRTYTGATNMEVTVNGTLGRTTSARKYKLVEEPVPTDLPLNILKLQPKTWFDKGTVERYSKALDDSEDLSEIDIPYIERIPGLIAEDVVDAGLEQYVTYGEADDQGNREVEGLMYDRLWTLLIPLVKDLCNRVTALEELIKKT
jgi:hypothetical protein